jgi:hypothetical protein
MSRVNGSIVAQGIYDSFNVACRAVHYASFVCRHCNGKFLSVSAVLSMKNRTCNCSSPSDGRRYSCAKGVHLVALKPSRISDRGAGQDR